MRCLLETRAQDIAGHLGPTRAEYRTHLSPTVAARLGKNALMLIIPLSAMAADNEFDLLTRVRKASQRCISLRGTVRCEGRPQFINVRNGSSLCGNALIC